MGKEVNMYLDEADKQKLESVFSEAKKKYNPAALERLEEAFAIAVGSKQSVGAEDPGQAGISFFFPGLTAKPWHDKENFPMCAKLEQSWEAIREELKCALENRRGFQQFVRRGTDQQTGPDVGVPREWKALYLKEHTEEFPENRAMCPETVKIIHDEPRLENYVFFSALDPGGFIAPHHATYNWVFNIHLGLVVPDTRADICGVRVKDEAKGWEEGKTHVFDSSFEHEAWNNTDSTRFVLVITTYHPELTEIEVSLLRRVNVELAKAADTAHDTALRQAEKELEGKKWWM
jgi:aspartyl/asparaginyl beta-hydroxylase (cupin superfamily)